MEPDGPQIAASPVWFPLKSTDPGIIGLLKLEEADYAAASFLDDRLLAGGAELIACPVSTIEAAVAGSECRPHYIFHTGHVGSTLISRLVGAHRSFFSVREPMLLRSFANSATSTASPLPLVTLLRLLSRTWRVEQRVVIKATSFLSELAQPLLSLDPECRAIFMFVQPLAYLRGIMGGAASRAETKLLAPARLQRLLRRVGTDWDLAAFSEGEWVAMSWLCEMTTLHEAAQKHSRQILWVDFDQFLDMPERLLPAILRRLGADPPAAEIAALLQSALMRQYSKGPEHAYDAALRRDVLSSADFEHAVEIKRGMDWLAAAAAGNTRVRALFDSR